MPSNSNESNSKRNIQITVFGATGLPECPSKSFVYANVSIDNVCWRSTQNSVDAINPVWEDEFNISIQKNTEIKVSAHRWPYLAPNSLGEVTISGSEAMASVDSCEGRITKELRLADSMTGMITIAFSLPISIYLQHKRRTPVCTTTTSAPRNRPFAAVHATAEPLPKEQEQQTAPAGQPPHQLQRTGGLLY